MWFRYNEPTTTRGHGFAGAHERAYGGVKGVIEVRSVFSLTVDFVLAFCLRYDLRSMVFQSGSYALLENVMLDRNY